MLTGRKGIRKRTIIINASNERIARAIKGRHDITMSRLSHDDTRSIDHFLLSREFDDPSYNERAFFSLISGDLQTDRRPAATRRLFIALDDFVRPRLSRR